MSTELLRDYILFFCEDAGTGPDGKLGVKGMYNELYASGFPAKQDRIVLAGFLEWERDVDGEQPFEIRVLDTEQKAIFTIEGHTKVDAREENRPPAKTHLIFPLDNLVFVKPGRYRVYMTVNDSELIGPSLYVLNSGNGE